VHDYWQAQRPKDSGFDAFWEKALRDGVIPDTAFPPKQVSVKPGIGEQAPGAAPQGLEIVFRPDPTIWDGRFANNGWLQELPKPLTKLTWDAVAMLSPKTAERLGLNSEDAVELKYQGRTIVAPAWVMPGHADESVTVFLGYGRTRAGRVGTGAGFDAGWIRPYATPWIGTGLEIRKTGNRWPLAATQTHSTMEGRDLVRVASLEEYRSNSKFAQADVEQNPLSLYPAVKYEGYAWGMALDLNSCTGCGACVAACQAENNIAVVGKKQVLIGREMHWIRIDRYYDGDLDDPKTYHEPVPCMHCENAPCELVCPVAATVHNSEGLNEMVYNRCVGTRYCSNNCPYKVRRFNFLLFSDWETPSLFGLRNPDVTVRSRGVMEKCTYCVQRISAAKIEAEEQDRTVRDGEIVTACQQSCPSEAIVFGDINDPKSRVSLLKAKDRNYRLLEELNTRPRTSYLARLRNPNPEIEKPAAL
jgi:Fe-S-cluster-containing dehydrogenase component